MRNVDATPSPNTSMYEKYLVEMELRFFSSIDNSVVFLSEYGGYLPLFKEETNRYLTSVIRVNPINTYEASFSPKALKSLIRHDFLCENVSNEYLPWYAPIPLLPTPPNGSVSTV